jgi:hypothetical protein
MPGESPGSDSRVRLVVMAPSWLVVLSRRLRESGNPAAHVMTLNFESSCVAIFAPSWILVLLN